MLYNYTPIPYILVSYKSTCTHYFQLDIVQELNYALHNFSEKFGISRSLIENLTQSVYIFFIDISFSTLIWKVEFHFCIFHAFHKIGIIRVCHTCLWMLKLHALKFGRSLFFVIFLIRKRWNLKSEERIERLKSEHLIFEISTSKPRFERS